MKTFIVPTDFSDTAKNAAEFAVGIASQNQDTQIILYNSFEKKYADRIEIMLAALEKLKEELLAGNAGVKITCMAEEENSFTTGLERLARHQSADIIIMGITGATRLEQLFMGSNTLDMVEKNVCPVMIIPPNAKFTGIKNVALTSDFKNVDKTIPVKPLQAILSLFNPVVHVVNVDSEHYVELTEEYKAEKEKINVMLEGYQHEFYFMRFFDFIEAISEFTEDYNIDLLITVPKNHSFLGGLFRSSATKKLKYHTHVPMIAIHE
ncbi:MAG TPA: universal stress protein [Panacibacter sp.]|nr:universal stress protein [Panacibacter sp.]